jgi:two-component system, sensor histidine kinase FlrB
MPLLPAPLTTDSSAPDAAALAVAFDAFSQVSRQLEESYGKLAQRLSALLEALPGAVLLLDGDERVQEANAAAAGLLGDALIGTTWPSLRDPEFLPAPGSKGGQDDLMLRDGRRVSLAQKSLQPGPGRVLLLTDITEKRKIEELLARHRRIAAMGEMAAALAHQIRTPLAAGLLYATNARRAGLSAEQRDGLLGKAINCLHDLEHLIGDMLQFARGATLDGNRFTLDDLLDTAEVSLRPILAAGQTLNVTRPSREVMLCGNRETLAGALMNLATNALNAAGGAAQVRIVARTTGIQAEIAVIDNGPGIPDELRGRIFDPFFTSRPEGTGLGLAVARSIAHAHHGEVTLVDGEAGRTTFSLRIPTAAPEAGIRSHDRNAAA